MRHQFVFSLELGLRLRFPTFVRRTFDSVRGTMTRNNYEKANAKRTEPVPNENRSVTPRKLWLTDGRLGDWEYCHDDRRQHSSFCFTPSLVRRSPLDHQPINCFLNLEWISSLQTLVRISASISSVETWWIVMVPSWTLLLKWWYFVLMWRVRGRIFGFLTLEANSTAPLLSSKTLQWRLGVVAVRPHPCCCISCTNSINGSTSLVAAEMAKYSLSVVDKAISDWSLDAQMTGQLA